MPEDTPATDRLAIIHIGASAVSLMVLEITGNKREAVEFMEQPVPLGRDIFADGAISRGTIERCVEILSSFLHSLAEFGIEKEKLTRVIVTNIITEAANWDHLFNRISVSCDLTPELLDNGEMTRLIYLKTRRRLQDTPSLKKKDTLVLHVGPGNTRVLLFKQGRIVRYTSYRLGAHRTREAVDPSHLAGPGFIRLIREHITGQLGQMLFDFREDKIENIVVIGFEMQLMNSFLTTDGSSKCTVNSLRKIISEASLLTDDEAVRRYQLDYHTAEALLPAMEINLAIAESFGLEHLHIPESDYESGLLLDLAHPDHLTTEFQNQVMRHVKVLAARYQSDPKHSKHVAHLCDRLFSELQNLHHLDENDALLLQIAAWLHEVGGYVSPRNHHKHSEYLILNSEIFGLRDKDIEIVAQLARYHRQSSPKHTHPRYRDLSPTDQIRVSKMAAILRVADALERTHTQRVRDLHCERHGERLVITLEGVQDAAVERLAMTQKGLLFQEIFGLEIILAEE